MLITPQYTSSWTPARELPRLGGAKVIAFDTETYDPRLKTHGPGWATGSGYVVGVSVATEDAAWYFPLRNGLGQGCPWGTERVTGWLRDTLGSNTPKVGANLTYDVGWLATIGVEVRGRLYDVQHAESLLTDSGGVSLDALGKKYVGDGKETDGLYAWSSLTYGGAPGPGQRSNIYRCPMELVGPYAEADASLPLAVLRKQWPLLRAQGLLDVFDMECRLIPLLVAMRQQGVRVDVERAHLLYDKFMHDADRLLQQLADEAGKPVSVNSNADLGELADKLGLGYPRTPTGKPQFVSKWLADHPHPVMQKVLEARQLLKLSGTFLKSYIIDGHVDGKLHGQFHQLKADGAGAKTGRFSSSTPNLQNIPARSDRGKLLRSLFVPFAGDTDWLKVDYSQIEYRFLAHFATGDGSDAVRSAFVADSKTDYHKMTQQLVASMTGLEIPRGPIKNINFGLLYGLGTAKLAKQIGVDAAAANEMFAAYHKAAPYVRATMASVQAEVQALGFISTIMGRRTRFDQWVPTGTKDAEPLGYDDAIRRYGSQIERAFRYKALNYRLQGSAADLMKAAMVRCWESGMFTRFRLPVLTVHDELDFSYRAGDTDPALLRELRDAMECALSLRVPVIADFETGPTWGDVAPIEIGAATQAGD